VRVAALPDADLEGALAEWRRWRSDQRVSDVHWIDVLYRAYLTGLIALIAFVNTSGTVGDVDVTGQELAAVLHRGPSWLGGLAALAVALGLRSGCRGGPLALERADVRHVLLAPVDRTAALRGPALRQLRFLTFLGIVGGAAAGELASRRFTGGSLVWIGSGALGGLTLVALAIGAAYVAGGYRLPRWIGSLLGIGLVLAAGLDAVGAIPVSPTEPFGRLLLWPIHQDLVGLAPLGLAAVLLVAGLPVLGAVSIEAAERRSTLVGQLRFAATLQDLRTVILLRRQLSLELPRRRPWVRLRVRGTRRTPILVRGLRGALRWPAARVARSVLLAGVAGAALRGTWSGTTPLVVLAGIALFVVGLDAVEALAQEIDHPSRREATPLDGGWLYLRHLPAATIVLLGPAVVTAAVALLPGPGAVPREVALLLILPLALGGVAGAAVSVLGGAPEINEGWALAPPEAQGMRLAFRTVWPPALATLGAAPVLAARIAVDDGGSGPEAALFAGLLVAVLFGLVCGWIRVAEQVRAWMRSNMEQASKRVETSDA
jgi:hypothetical protein